MQESFALFDRVLLLVGGKQAFFGTPTDAAGSLMRTLAESRFAEDQSSQVRTLLV
jgi:ABC-type multidrug transport system ATPase subunit